MTGRYFFSVILLICVATAAAQDEDLCPYTLVTKTGPCAIDDATIALIFSNSRTITIPNLREHSILCTPSFQSDKLDVFRFYGPCDLEDYRNVTFKLVGSEGNYCNIELFQLEALLPNTFCYSRMYHADCILDFLNDECTFNFCGATEAVGTEKQKLTGASLLRLVGMPSYTT